jgi:hypothetical protein
MVREREALYANRLIRWLFLHSQAFSLLRNQASRLVQESLLKEQGLKGYSSSTPELTALTVALFQRIIDEIINAGAVPIVVDIPRQSDMTSNFPLGRADITAAGAKFIDGRDFLVKSDYWEINSHWTPSGHLKTAQKSFDVISQLESFRRAVTATD